MRKIHMVKAVQSSSLYKIYGLVLVIVVVWGLSWPISKIGLNYISPWGFVAGRLVIGTLSMFIITTAAGRFVWPRYQDLPIILVISLLQITFFMLFVNFGLHYVDAGRSAILAYTTPIWVIPVAIFFFDEKVTAFQWVGFLLGLIGIVILICPWSVNWSNTNEVKGNIFLLLAALSWAISMLCTRHMEWRRAPIELLPWQLLFATIPISLLAWKIGAFDGVHWNFTLVECLMYSGVVATTLGYLGVVIVSKELPSSKASLSFLGVPVCGFMSSAIILHEPISTVTIVAISFIMAGLIFVAANSH